MKPIALRTKLTLLYTSILALFMIARAVAGYYSLAQQLDASISEELIERSAALRGYMKVADDRVTYTHDPNDAEEAVFVATATRLFQIYRLSDGNVVDESPEMRVSGFHLTPSEVAALATAREMQDIDTRRGRVRMTPSVITADDGSNYVLLVGTSLASRDDALDNFLTTEAILVPFSLVAAALLGWWMARLALSPLKTAAEEAAGITAAQLDRRLPIRGADDELDHLSAAFNDVLSRLETAIGEMKQFTASIAHELRTPLTVLRGEAEIALMQGRSEEDYRRVLSSQLEEFDKLTRMINQTLTLARAESGEIQLDRSPVDFSALATGLVQEMQAVANARGVMLEAVIEPAILLSGDAGWLERMLLNLMDNGVKFTPPNGRVSVDVRREGDFAILRVADTGCGIAPEALPHIFDRFFRGDPSRSRGDEGAGLGLTLVHWIVQQHHGSIDVESQASRGTVFTIRFPLAYATQDSPAERVHLKHT